MWVCNVKNSWSAVQITSNSQWFSHIAIHPAVNWVLKAFDPSEYIKLSQFLLMFSKLLTALNILNWACFCLCQFNIQTVKIKVETQIHMHWSVVKQKLKIFHDFRVSVINPIPKNENLEITEIHQKPKMLKCEYVNSKILEMLFK